MFPGLIDLVSELVGGVAVSASDEFFAPKESLLRASEPVFIPEKYTDRGKWMDGWESRRRRTPGHDWCVVRLGLPGRVRTIDVDTSHFLGNFPSHCSIDASACAADPGEQDWKPLLAKMRLEGGGHNIFDVTVLDRVTHVRLNIFPDGGVARLHVYGDVLPDFAKLKAANEPVDFASVVNGGRVVASSDEFFGHQQNLIMPGRPVNMGGGWETRRRRGPGYDWIVVQLGARTAIQRALVETQHYKGNYPDRCSLDACDAANAVVQGLIVGKTQWVEILPESKLAADAVRLFETELSPAAPATHVRLNIFPDGGISRLRVFGKIVE
jgi:allantoicase